MYKILGGSKKSVFYLIFTLFFFEDEVLRLS